MSTHTPEQCALLRRVLHTAAAGAHLSEDETTGAMEAIMAGAATDAQIAALITALKINGETVEEIAGAARAMRAHAVRVPVQSRDGLVDIVGTGGDMAGTFNISTAASLVAAGAGLRVAKHGNRAVSSDCGSADVLEALGVTVDLTPEGMARCIDEVGIGFLFARQLHPAMRHAARARQEIGLRTIFNILGPLTNPADAQVQVVGVYEERLCQVCAQVLCHLGVRSALVVHGADGLDEITLCERTRICRLQDGAITSHWFAPESIGMQRCAAGSLRGGDAVRNAAIITDVLSGLCGPARDVVVLNAAAALMAAGRTATIAEGIGAASDAIDSGRARETLARLRSATQDLRPS